jgi:DNA polymerase-3 subunit alpha
MTIEGDDQNAISKYVAECKARGITILPPDINTGDSTFRPTPTGIRYRITTIRHVGESAIKGIQKLRPISSFDDFMEKRVKKDVKGNTVDALIKAGCFDFDTPDRGELLWRVEMLNRTKTQIKNEFIPQRYILPDKVKAAYEKEVLGLYLSHHPMEKYSFQPLSSFANEGKCLQGGEITSIETRPDKKGKEMAFVTLDTLHGSVRVLVFAYIWAREDTKSLFQTGKFVLIRGKRSGDACIFDSGEEL